MMDITINGSQRLFVIPAGTGYTCLGFDTCYEQARQLARRLGQAVAGALFEVRAEQRGTLAQYAQYRKLLDLAAKRGGIQETWFKDATPEPVRRLLEAYRQSGERLRLYYGNPDTGCDWLEEYETIGFIGRSTGITKVPLLIANRGSRGGGAVIDHCIVKLQNVCTKMVLWQHPSYHQPGLSIRHGDSGIEVLAAGKVHARVTSDRKATTYIAFLNGTRMRSY